MTNSDELGSQPAPGQPLDSSSPQSGHTPPGYTQPFGSPSPPPAYGQPAYGQSGYGQSGYGQPPPPPGYGPPGTGQGWGAVPAPGGIPLRPLSLGDLYSGSVNAARRNPVAIFGLTAILMTISAVITSVAQVAFRASANANLTPTGPGNQISSTQVSNFFADLIPVLLVTVVLAFVLENVLSGLLTAVIGREALGRKVGIGEAWSLGRIGWVLAAAGLLVLIGIGVAVPVVLTAVVLALAHAPVGVVVAVAVLGGLATVVVEIIVQVRLCITIPAVVLERIGPGRAVIRSWQLTRGSSWRLFGINLLTAIIAYIVALVLQIPFTIGAAAAGSSRGTILALIIAAIGSVVAATVIRPFSAGVVVLLYLDMRMRREGLDLTLRNAAQGQLTGEEFATIWQPPAPGQWPPPGAGGWQSSQWPAQGPPASW